MKLNQHLCHSCNKNFYKVTTYLLDKENTWQLISVESLNCLSLIGLVFKYQPDKGKTLTNGNIEFIVSFIDGQKNKLIIQKNPIPLEIEKLPINCPFKFEHLVENNS